MSTTKRQALKEFKWVWQRILSEQPNRKDNKIAKREQWSNFVDSLNKDGEVTDEQAATWINPF